MTAPGRRFASELAELAELAERPLPREEFERRIAVPLDDAERQDARALIDWFTRRYPTVAARLAYASRAWRRWNRPSHIEAP